jgi:hypothetical protein
MTVPSQADLDKRKKNRDVLAKKVTEDGHLKETELVRIIRKAIDSAWMTAAHKLVFLEDRIIPDMDESTRTKWLLECNICHKMFKLDCVNVDHRIGEFECKTREDFSKYIFSRLDVGYDDLQILCIDDPKKNHKGCHEVKTYMERHGVSWNEALCQKECIDIIKQKKDKSWLSERGITPKSNAKLRREQIIEELRKEHNE